MKKILSIAAALVIAAAFISCGGNSDEFDGKTDTVLTISAPSVKAKAYPGVNYVTWTVVPQAVSYDVYRIGDGAASGTYLGNVAAAAGTAKADIASSSNIIADGKTYEYVVVALAGNTNNTSGATVPTRSIYVKANSGKASVKAYVPAAGTAIADFTDSYTKNFIKKFDEKNLAKNAKVTFVNDVIGGGKLAATFAATAGYQFGVKFINKTQPDYIKKSTDPTSWVTNYLEDYTANVASTAYGAGTYEAYLTMKSVCGYYADTKVFDLGEYKIEALKVITGTGTPTAKYNADGKKVVVSWTPALLTATNALAPTTNYKVYRATTASLVDGDTLVPVTATVASRDIITEADSDWVDHAVSAAGASSGKDTIGKVYYVEDEVPANNVKYTYVVVNTDGTEFENMSDTETTGYKSCVAAEYSLQTTDAPTIAGVAISKDKDNLYNQIKVTAAKANGKQTLDLSYVILDTTVTSGNNYSKTIPADGFKKIDITKNNDVTNESFISYDVTKAANGTYLFKLTASETGKAPQSVYKIVYVTGATVNISQITFTPGESAGKYLVTDKHEDADKLGAFKYALVKVEVVTPKDNYGDYVEVTSTVTDLTLKTEEISNGDFASSEYGKNNGTSAGTTTEGKIKTYPYAVVSDLKAGSSTAGKSTKIEWSVKKSLANDATNYLYSDNGTHDNKSVVVQF